MNKINTDQSLENYVIWLKNIINEKNIIALSDGLKANEIFLSKYKGQISNQILKYFIIDLMEKVLLQQQIGISIIYNSLKKGDSSFIASETTKRFDNSQSKIILFALQIIKQNLEEQLTNFY